MKHIKKISNLVKLAITAIVISMPFYYLVPEVRAAEMADGAWTRAALIDTIGFTTVGALSAGDFIMLTFKPDDVAASASGCKLDALTIVTQAFDQTNDTVKITVPTGGIAAGAHTINSCQYLSTFNAAGYEAHSVAINTSTAAGVQVDFGVSVIYASNTVTVKATVPQFINMQISASTIDLGVLSTAAVASASHTLIVNTNDVDGYMIQIASDAKLNTASSADINDIAENGTVTAGTEGYGIAVTAGAATVEQGDFSDDDTPVPQSATNFIAKTTFTTGGGDTHTVAYRAAIAGSTEAGNYDQIVTYTIATQ